MKVGKRAGKAHAAAAAAAFGVLGTAYADAVLTGPEWVAVVGTGVVAWLTTYFVPNGSEPNLTTSTPQHGEPVGG